MRTWSFYNNLSRTGDKFELMLLVIWNWKSNGPGMVFVHGTVPMLWRFSLSQYKVLRCTTCYLDLHQSISQYLGWYWGCIFYGQQFEMPLILVNLTYSYMSTCFWYIGTYQSRKSMCASEAVEVTLQQSCKYRSSILYGLVGWEIEEIFWLKIFVETLIFDSMALDVSYPDWKIVFT